MADIITRVYGSHENAQAAVDELKAYRFDDTGITVVSYLGGFKTGSNAAVAEFNEIVNAVAAGWIPKAEAAIYALSITRGATLVTFALRSAPRAGPPPSSTATIRSRRVFRLKNTSR